MKYTYEQIKKEFDRLGYVWHEFHVFAIRSKANTPNKFDDLIGFIDRDKIYFHTGTTNSGTKPLKAPTHPEGVAMITPGQYVDAWALGKHKGKYDALVQVKPVYFTRDNDKDTIHEVGPKLYFDVRGFNWHRAHEDHESQNVENWSEGCVVQNNPAQYDSFIKACSESGNLYFTGTILEEF